jgi:hypothetical protein
MGPSMSRFLHKMGSAVMATRCSKL